MAKSCCSGLEGRWVRLARQWGGRGSWPGPNTSPFLTPRKPLASSTNPCQRSRSLHTWLATRAGITWVHMNCARLGRLRVHSISKRSSSRGTAAPGLGEASRRRLLWSDTTDTAALLQSTSKEVKAARWRALAALAATEAFCSCLCLICCCCGCCCCCCCCCCCICCSSWRSSFWSCCCAWAACLCACATSIDDTRTTSSTNSAPLAVAWSDPAFPAAFTRYRTALSNSLGESGGPGVRLASKIFSNDPFAFAAATSACGQGRSLGIKWLARRVASQAPRNGTTCRMSGHRLWCSSCAAAFNRFTEFGSEGFSDSLEARDSSIKNTRGLALRAAQARHRTTSTLPNSCAANLATPLLALLRAATTNPGPVGSKAFAADNAASASSADNTAADDAADDDEDSHALGTVKERR
mmetsp:Transcript_40029/g.73885  ORF Transcript_40029/g.73885 Transcript_40029/m.73885 type:complete len:411 (-) Transcript_40029:267-1499(-)